MQRDPWDRKLTFRRKRIKLIITISLCFVRVSFLTSSKMFEDFVIFSIFISYLAVMYANCNCVSQNLVVFYLILLYTNCNCVSENLPPPATAAKNRLSPSRDRPSHPGWGPSTRTSTSSATNARYTRGQSWACCTFLFILATSDNESGLLRHATMLQILHPEHQNVFSDNATRDTFLAWRHSYVVAEIVLRAQLCFK